MFVEILKIEFYTEFDVVVATDSANVGVKVACHPKYPSLTIMLRRAHSYLSTGFLTFNVADTQKKSTNGVGFLYPQPIKTIEAWLLEAGNLTHPNDVAIENVKFFLK